MNRKIEREIVKTVKILKLMDRQKDRQTVKKPGRIS